MSLLPNRRIYLDIDTFSKMFFLNTIKSKEQLLKYQHVAGISDCFLRLTISNNKPSPHFNQMVHKYYKHNGITHYLIYFSSQKKILIVDVTQRNVWPVTTVLCTWHQNGIL